MGDIRARCGAGRLELSGSAPSGPRRGAFRLPGDRCDVKAQLVQLPVFKRLLDDARPAADRNGLAAGRRPSLLERSLDAVRHEGERGAASFSSGSRAWCVRDEDRNVEGRIFAPPSVRVRVVLAGALSAAEHFAAHDDGARVREDVAKSSSSSSRTPPSMPCRSRKLPSRKAHSCSPLHSRRADAQATDSARRRSRRSEIDMSVNTLVMPLRPRPTKLIDEIRGASKSSGRSKGAHHEADHSLPVVRRQRRGRGRAVHVDLPGRRGLQASSATARLAGRGGHGHGRSSSELRGQDYVGLNGGPQFPFTEAVSFQVRARARPRSTSTGTSSSTAASRTVRLAQGPLRPVVAGHADWLPRPSTIPTARRRIATMTR